MVSIRCIPDQLSNITYKFPSSKVLYGLYENLKKIQECKQVCIFEGEKSILKSKTLFGENDISVASFGCNLSQYHLELLKSLGVNTLMFCYDRETEEKILKKLIFHNFMSFLIPLEKEQSQLQWIIKLIQK